MEKIDINKVLELLSEIYSRRYGMDIQIVPAKTQTTK